MSVGVALCFEQGVPELTQITAVAGITRGDSECRLEHVSLINVHLEKQKLN